MISAWLGLPTLPPNEDADKKTARGKSSKGAHVIGVAGASIFQLFFKSFFGFVLCFDLSNVKALGWCY